MTKTNKDILNYSRREGGYNALTDLAEQVEQLHDLPFSWWWNTDGVTVLRGACTTALEFEDFGDYLYNELMKVPISVLLKAHKKDLETYGDNA